MKISFMLIFVIVATILGSITSSVSAQSINECEIPNVDRSIAVSEAGISKWANALLGRDAHLIPGNSEPNYGVIRIDGIYGHDLAVQIPEDQLPRTVAIELFDFFAYMLETAEEPLDGTVQMHAQDMLIPSNIFVRNLGGYGFYDMSTVAQVGRIGPVDYVSLPIDVEAFIGNYIVGFDKFVLLDYVRDLFGAACGYYGTGEFTGTPTDRTLGMLIGSVATIEVSMNVKEPVCLMSEPGTCGDPLTMLEIGTVKAFGRNAGGQYIQVLTGMSIGWLDRGSVVISDEDYNSLAVTGARVEINQDVEYLTYEPGQSGVIVIDRDGSTYFAVATIVIGEVPQVIIRYNGELVAIPIDSLDAGSNANVDLLDINWGQIKYWYGGY